MTQEKISRIRLEEILFDENNANEGTERGRYMVEESIRRFGFADAGTLDKNNKLLNGEKRTEVASEISLSDDAIILDVDGTRPVYLRRKDLDLDDPQDDRARQLAYFLNRSQEVSLRWNTSQVIADIEAGVDLNAMFNESEVATMYDKLAKAATDAIDTAMGDALLSGFPFTPDTNPQMGQQGVTQEALDRESERIHRQFGSSLQGDQVELICPHCSETFYVNKSEFR
jgi:hypothetical protein